MGGSGRRSSVARIHWVTLAVYRSLLKNWDYPITPYRLTLADLTSQA